MQAQPSLFAYGPHSDQGKRPAKTRAPLVHILKTVFTTSQTCETETGGNCKPSVYNLYLAPAKEELKLVYKLKPFHFKNGLCMLIKNNPYTEGVFLSLN